MAIHLDILNPRQAEAGKIKIGGLGKSRTTKSGGESRLPRKLDHFLVTKTVRDPETGEFEPDEALMKILPKDKDQKCRTIPILLDSDIIDEVFPHTLACYAGRQLHCKGDGKTATRWGVRTETSNGRKRQVRTGESNQRKCPCSYLNAKSGFVCRPHGTLWVTIAAGEETRIGVRHAFRTTSWNSVRWILSGLDSVQRQVGTLVAMPLTMVVGPHQVNTADGTRVVQIVHVELRTKDLLALQRHAIQTSEARQKVRTLASHPVVLGLPAPGENETARDQSEIQQEYHPDPPEDIDGNDVLDYNPVTGEVYSQATGHEPEDETQDPPAPDHDAELPDDHPIRHEIKRLLTVVARVRDFSDDDLKKGRAEIWNEVCEATGQPRLPWKSLTTHRAEVIDPKLREIIAAKEEGEI